MDAHTGFLFPVSLENIEHRGQRDKKGVKVLSCMLYINSLQSPVLHTVTTPSELILSPDQGILP